MKILPHPVPYVDRWLLTASGTAVVWPFLNTEKGPGPYELFLDTNALRDARWFGQLPDEIRTKCVINPWPALQEQWFSNPDFRESASSRINEWTKPFVKLGARLRDHFAQQQEQVLRANEAALRTQFSLIIPYVVIMKSLGSRKLAPEQAMQYLQTMGEQDIPRFTSAMMLMAIGALLKKDQSLKLPGDSKPAFSYLSSFLDFQPGKKDETDYINVPYLRNRAGDLNLWLLLPLLRQQGYRFVGTPAIVTGDRALHRLIARVIPPLLTTDLAISFALSDEGLPTHWLQRIMSFVAPIQIRTGSTEGEHLARMTSLFELAKSCCDDEREREALDQIFATWWRPGFGKKIDLGVMCETPWACRVPLLPSLPRWASRVRGLLSSAIGLLQATTKRGR